MTTMVHIGRTLMNTGRYVMSNALNICENTLPAMSMSGARKNTHVTCMNRKKTIQHAMRVYQRLPMRSRNSFLQNL